MSVELLGWARRQTTGGADAKLVLLMLALRANGDGFAYGDQPALERIAAEAELPVARILPAADTLLRNGLVQPSGDAAGRPGFIVGGLR